MDGESSSDDQLIWYVSYGSNLSSERLRLYLEGGTPPGGARRNPGARDPRPPRHSIPVHLPGTLYFAGESPQWGGGVAFYDHFVSGSTAARAYLVTVEQFADIAAQEMHRAPGADNPIEHLVVSDLYDDGAQHHVGPGLYETLVNVGSHDGLRMLTFTAQQGRDGIQQTIPSAAYLRMFAAGLAESHGWQEKRITAYFAEATKPAPVAGQIAGHFR